MTEQGEIYSCLESLQQLTKEIPLRFQQRLPTELLSSLSAALVQGQIFEIVSMLQELQNTEEKQLFQRRLNLQKTFHEEKAEFQKHFQKATSGITDPSELLRQTRLLDEERDSMLSRQAAEVKQFDTDAVMQLDQKVIDQQGTLEKAGVPGFHITNNPLEIQTQMYMLDFINRLGRMKKNGQW